MSNSLKKGNILVVSPILSKTYSGWGNFTKNLIFNVHGKCKIELLTLKSECPYDIFPFKEFNFPYKNSILIKLKFFFFSFFYILKNNYKVVVLPNLYFYSVLLVSVKYFKNIEFVGRVCANELIHIKNGPFFRKVLFNKIDRLIVLNKDSIINSINLGFKNNNIFLIPNPVISQDRDKLKKDKDIDILFVGEINPRKGVHVLLDAFFNLNSNLSNPFNLCIVGPVTDFNYFNDLKIKYNIQNSHLITLLGRLDKETLNEIYTRTKVFVLPSFSEGMPNVLLEAMSFGIAVIGSSIPGIVENIEDGKNGFLFNTSDVVGLQKHMELLLNDIHLRSFLAENALEFIRNERNPEFIYRQYLNVFLGNE